MRAHKRYSTFSVWRTGSRTLEHIDATGEGLNNLLLEKFLGKFVEFFNPRADFLKGLR
jgi:hypothetical protein